MASASPSSPLRRVTLKDVARALKISPATVSNAYNRPDQLSPSLRARVLETAQTLGYSGPDPLASSLRRGRSGVVGLLYDATLSYAFADPAASLFLGVARAVESQALNLLLIPSPQDTAPVRTASVDGFIVYSASDGSELLPAVMGRGLPVVLVDQTPLPGAAYIGIDDAGGAREAARHLLDLGHTTIGILSLELGWPHRHGPVTPERETQLTYRTTATRLHAYREEIGTRATLHVMEAHGNTPQEGALMTLELLEAYPEITALLCMSDVLAQGVLEAARQLGLQVPNDLSVVGYDDIPSSAALGLSSVHQPTAHKGELAGRALLDLLGGEPTPQHVTLPTHLVARSSSGKRRDSGR
ncbi:LacI family DNA-binding transcriptional regulator [Deinococcus sp. KNUC1210]|uniref:LacI family DNA-binding transcriptional regulator n=1 Tax=Deinococcus sp. KNUC1210 TaxID=2917691 RepID=UPI001EF159A0|nr:LacI family DNA-binding transcriptional regulator [Deinococcus sp. KNUC1210]ULH16503.1 LacI family DNA-binding transcriptional regulator [Deinococcus sp. KNUC1210]